MMLLLCVRLCVRVCACKKKRCVVVFDLLRDDVWFGVAVLFVCLCVVV